MIKEILYFAGFYAAVCLLKHGISFLLKKETESYKRLGLNFIISSIIALLVTLMIHLIYTVKDLSGMVGCEAILGGGLALLDPVESFLRMKKREIRKNRLFTCVTIILLFILEIFAFNSRGRVSYPDEFNVDMTSFSENGIVPIGNGSYITVDTGETETENIYLHFTSTSSESVSVTVSTSETNIRYTDYKTYELNTQNELYNYLKVKNARYYRLSFSVTEYKAGGADSLKLDEFTFNVSFPFYFNTYRVVLFTSVILLFYFISIFFKEKEIKNSKSKFFSYDLTKRTELVLLGLGILTFVIFFIVTLSNKNYFYSSYEDLDITYSNIYFQQFDAFMKGQLNLDIPVSNALSHLENPYVPANRNYVDYYWDHAFYNGQYYSYYGIAPILVVMYPIYFLSGGYLPNTITMEMIGAILSVLMMALLVCELYKTYSKKRNLPFLLLLIVTSVFTSLAMYITYNDGSTFEEIYHIPYAYGMAFMLGMLYLSFKAYHNSKLRPLYLSLAAIAVVLTVMARPNMLLGVLIILPLYIKMLFEKEPVKNKLKYLIPFFAIVGAGAIIVCIYNYKRFGSVLEFGSSYQLTIIDATSTSISYLGAKDAIYHYIIQPLDLSDQFPNIIMNWVYLNNEAHSYIQCSAGVLSIPLFVLGCGLPFIFTKKDKLELRIAAYIVPVTVVISAIVTYCYAGVCMRYLLDIYPLATIAGIILLVKASDRITHPTLNAHFYRITFAVCIVSIYITVSLLFNNFDGMSVGDAQGLLLWFRSIFNNYNL